MPDLNHRFQAGRMNKDLDERLVPNGEYRDAMNVQVATSDGSNVGSLQNIMGNLDLSSVTIDPSGTAGDLYVVGSITDDKTDKLYWLVSGSGVDFIAEYDYKTGDVSPIVVDIFPVNTVPGNDSGRILNFDKRYLITGINIIEDNLFWTDNNTEPKKINITRVRIGSVDFVTHTDFYVPNPDVSSNTDYVSVGPIRHEHITVAKKAPKTAPKLEMKYTTRGDLDLDGIAGEIEVMMTNQDISGFWDGTADPPGFSTSSVSITFNDSPDFKNSDKLIIEATHPSGQEKKQGMIVQITGGIDSSGVWATPGTCEVNILSWDAHLDLTETNFTVKLKQDDPLFQFKFPRFAYRYKFANGEYSTFSPFSEIAFLPEKFDYLPKEGYNLGMVNAVRALGVCDFVDERYIPDDVISIDILCKESNSPAVYSVKTINRISPDPTGAFDEWNGISPTAIVDPLVAVPIQTHGYINIESEMIHAMLPTNQLLRSWDNIPRKALAQEVVGNRLVYGNYLQNYNITNLHVQRPTALRYADGSYGQILLRPSDNITVDLKLVLKPRSLGEEITEELDAGKAYTYRSAKTIKSLRTYQLGVIYIDEFGRETPVFSNSLRNHTLHVDGNNAPLSSKLKAQVFSAKPDWAKHFKFLIKETSNEYYNLAMDRWYMAEDGNIWLSFPSSERNKVDLETFLILKKAHDSSEAVKDGGKYKILDIDNEAPLFLKTKREPKGQINDGLAVGTPPVTQVLIGGVSGSGSIHFPYPGRTHLDLEKVAFQAIYDKITDEGSSDFQFRIVSVTDGASSWYEIKNIAEKESGWLRVTSKKRFGEDMSISTPFSVEPSSLEPGYGNLTVEFIKKEIVNKPEFDGRFFVKILKDVRLQEYIIGYITNAQSQYVVSSSIVSQYINPEAGAVTNNPNGPNYSGGTNWFGQDKDLISLSQKNDESSPHAGGNGQGKEYWQRAGQDKSYTSTDDGQSSGWFIDKVEAFRSFKYTEHFFTNNNDPNWNTYEANVAGNTFKSAFPSYNDPNPIRQLQVIGTNTHSSTPSSYLGISSCLPPLDTLRDATVAKHGRITPSVGIDPELGGTTGANLIHLSYAGAGERVSTYGNRASNGTGDLKTAFEEWAGDYVEEEFFINSITTSGTIWRWKEDPGNIVYRTLGTVPSGGTNPNANLTAQEWAAQGGPGQTDYDNYAGIELFNYTKISDYSIQWEYDFNGWCGGCQNNTAGTTVHSAFVSQSRPDDYDYFDFYAGGYATAWGVYSGLYLTLGAWELAQLAITLTYPTASGVNTITGIGTSAHDRWPMFTEDWSKPRNRRRRYSIHAEPLPDPTPSGANQGNGPNSEIDGTEGLGGVFPHFYLPTNPPDNAPHFGVDGSVLTNPATSGYPVLPGTEAPGIRPDGMYTGMDHPNGSYTLVDLDGVTQTYTTIPSHRVIDSQAPASLSPAPGSVTWQILDTYLEDGNDEGYFSPNPAIWETEPKEDVGLEIYHEVGQIYPTELNEKTLEQFFGPIHTDLSRNSQVTSWMPGIGGGWTTMQTNSGVTGDTDIRIALAEMLNGEVTIALKDINGNYLDVNAVTLPQVGARLMFQRADGSMTEVSIKAVPAAFLPFFAVESDVHNYEVTLPWFNAYSFGNGVESNRIRDDYNQVTIDKGPKVSTVLEEPYTEEHRSSGLIYSGIYNTTSGINNLNQFITAEKITKDLNPSYGSIQKLFTRNTNLVTFCEDKVFKILADKDALYNADGNINLTASENVLGQTIPFVGDYGISTNPESFAADSYRAYFADRTRGSILRLSQDGLTPISSVGMTDWFADNLSASNRIMGNFDDRKSEYNISLNYFDFGRNKVGIIGSSKGVGSPCNPSKELTTTYEVASRLQEGDVLIGVGIPAGTTVVSITKVAAGKWIIVMNQPPSLADVGPLGAPLGYGPVSSTGLAPQCVWWTELSIVREDTPDPLTLSFSEINKGWVSFKSFHFEDGLSLNNDYFTFKGGQLFKHHANPIHNTFYDTILAQDAFTESSVEVLFNELPGSVKSFQTLNYEGSQSKITADIDNSGEYWDNKDKLGWYVDNMYTNLQEAEPSEFKDKEGKWFSTVKGVATEWLDDGTAGNIDTNEFSYQGIDEAGAKTGDDQYTSWDCNNTAACPGWNGVHGYDAPSWRVDSGQTFASSWEMVEWFFSNPNKMFKNYFHTVMGVGNGVAMGPGWGTLNSYQPWLYAVNGVDATGGMLAVIETWSINCGGAATVVESAAEMISCGIAADPINFWVGMTYMEFRQASGVNPSTGFGPGTTAWGFLNALNCVGPGGPGCVEIPGIDGEYPTESACLADTTSPCAGTCIAPNTVIPHPTSATAANGCNDGDGAVEVILAGAATSWSVTYVDPSIWSSHPSGGTVVYVDPNNPYGYNGWSSPAVLPQGGYAAYVIDNLGCELTVPFTVDCGTGTGCPSPNPHTLSEQIVHDLEIVGVCQDAGSIQLQMTNLGSGTSSWTIEYFSVVGAVSTSIYADPATHYNNSITIPLTNLVAGDYEYVITDDLLCTYTTPFTIQCLLCPPGCTDPTATNYDPLACIDDGSCNYCDGELTWDAGRGLWVPSPIWHDFTIGIQNVWTNGSCSDNPIVMLTNGAIELNFIALGGGATSFSYSLIPGANVDPTLQYGTFPTPFYTVPTTPGAHTYSWSTSNPPAVGDWELTIEDNLGNTYCYPFVIACELPPACPNGPVSWSENVTDATSTNCSNSSLGNLDGSITATITNYIGNAMTSNFNVEWFKWNPIPAPGGSWNSVYVDPLIHVAMSGASFSLTNQNPGNYKAVITDNNGCIYEREISIGCDPCDPTDPSWFTFGGNNATASDCSNPLTHNSDGDFAIFNQTPSSLDWTVQYFTSAGVLVYTDPTTYNSFGAATTVTGLPPGDYIFTITYPLTGCAYSESFTVGCEQGGVQTSGYSGRYDCSGLGVDWGGQGNGTGTDGIPINTPASGKFGPWELMDYGSGNPFGLLHGFYPFNSKEHPVRVPWTWPTQSQSLAPIVGNTDNTKKQYGAFAVGPGTGPFANGDPALGRERWCANSLNPACFHSNVPITAAFAGWPDYNYLVQQPCTPPCFNAAYLFWLYGDVSISTIPSSFWQPWKSTLPRRIKITAPDVANMSPSNWVALGFDWPATSFSDGLPTWYKFKLYTREPGTLPWNLKTDFGGATFAPGASTSWEYIAWDPVTYTFDYPTHSHPGMPLSGASTTTPPGVVAGDHCHVEYKIAIESDLGIPTFDDTILPWGDRGGVSQNIVQNSVSYEQYNPNGDECEDVDFLGWTFG